VTAEPIATAPAVSLSALILRGSQVTAADTLRTVLGQHGIESVVTRFDRVVPAEVAAHDIIILTFDADGAAVDLEPLQDSGLPIFASGLGTDVFERLGSRLGGRRAARAYRYDGRSPVAGDIVVEDARQSVYRVPVPIEIDTGGVLSLYHGSPVYDCRPRQCPHLTELDPQHEAYVRVGRPVDGSLYYLVGEMPRYFGWFPPVEPSVMTEVGRQLLVNIIWQMATSGGVDFEHPGAAGSFTSAASVNLFLDVFRFAK